MTHQTKKKQPDDAPGPSAAHQPPTTTSALRRRVWRACEACRRKKIKCDGVEPICAQCATSGADCHWVQTKDRAALSRHYVQELEARLMHMESLFQKIAPVLDQMGHSPATLADLAGPAPATATGLASVPELEASNGHGQHDEASPEAGDAHTAATAAASSPSSSEPAVKIEDDMSESFGQLALDEHGHMRWIGGSSTMSLIQWFKAQTATAAHPFSRISPMEDDPRAPGPSANKLYFPASAAFGKVHALPGPEEVEYPQRDLADKLVDAYFSRLHFLLPVIDKPSFVLKYSYLMENTHDAELHKADTSFIALVFAVFACAARLVDDPRLSPVDADEGAGMGMVYYERAQILQYITHTTIQVTHVQCFILMSSFLCSVNCLPQAWLLVGQAVRTAQDLGLHRSPRRLLCSPIEKETRRKIWWSVYSLDRALALALGRPLGCEDSDCDVELPVDLEDDQLPEYFTGAIVSRERPALMAGFNALTSLYKIAGRVLRQVYAIENCRDNLEPERRADLQRAVEFLDRDLTKWCDDLPVVFKSNPVNEQDVSMGAVLCSHYYSILTTLHRNFLPVKREQPVAPRSVAKAVSSARACIRLAPSIKSVVPPSHHLAFFIQHLFSSAVIILLFAMHTPDLGSARAAMQEAQSCLLALQTWEGLWPGARKCRELLNELTQTATDAIRAHAAQQAQAQQLQQQSQPQTIGRGQPLPSLSTVVTSSSPPGPQSPLSASSERRGSIQGINVSTQGKAVRNRARRDRSNDPYLHKRSVSATSPYRTDSANRARSTSRRRPDDDLGPGASAISFQHSAYSGLSYTSSTSPPGSPGSLRGLPSPTMPVMEPLAPLPPSLNCGASPTFGMAPMQVPSPPRFDYHFGLGSPTRSTHSQSPGLTSPTPAHATAESWHTRQDSAAGGSGLGFFSDTSQQLGAGPPTYGPQPHPAMMPRLDSGFPAFDGMGSYPANTSGSLTDTGADDVGIPPYAVFDGPGLPFHGLDFIMRYGQDDLGAPETQPQDSWQTFDGFRYDPDLAFSIGDLLADTNGGVHST